MNESKSAIQRQPAEQEFAEELAALWRKRIRGSVRRSGSFRRGRSSCLLGGRDRERNDDFAEIRGQRRLMEIAVATLATDRALLLLGLPGTAKSWVSEHLAAAISGDSDAARARDSRHGGGVGPI